MGEAKEEGSGRGIGALRHAPTVEEEEEDDDELENHNEEEGPSQTWERRWQYCIVLYCICCPY